MRAFAKAKLATAAALQKTANGVLAGLVFLVTLAYRLSVAPPTHAQGGFDERLYLLFAETFQETGFAGLWELAERSLADRTLSMGPLPLRLGTTLLQSASLGIPGVPPLQRLSLENFAIGCLTVPLAFLTLTRIVSHRVAFAAAILLAVSPLSCALGRSALADPIVAFAALAATLATFHFAERPSPLRMSGLFLASLLLILTKEAGVFLLPGLALLLRSRERSRSLPGVVALALALLAAVSSLTLMAPSWTKLLEVYRAYYAHQSQIPYALNFQSGAFHRYGVDLLIVTPLLSLLAVGGLFHSERRSVQALLLLSAPYLLFLAWAPLKNLRFFLPLEWVFCAFAALGIETLAFRYSTTRLRRGLLTSGLVGLSLVGSHWQHEKLFVRAKIYDPVTAELARASRFIP